MGFGSPEKLFAISLGQGQGIIAENAIAEAKDKVLLTFSPPRFCVNSGRVRFENITFAISLGEFNFYFFEILGGCVCKKML